MVSCKDTTAARLPVGHNKSMWCWPALSSCLSVPSTDFIVSCLFFFLYLSCWVFGIKLVCASCVHQMALVSGLQLPSATVTQIANNHRVILIMQLKCVCLICVSNSHWESLLTYICVKDKVLFTETHSWKAWSIQSVIFCSQAYGKKYLTLMQE